MLTHGRLRVIELSGIPTRGEDLFSAMIERTLHAVVIRQAIDREVVEFCAAQLDRGALPGGKYDNVQVGGQPLTATPQDLGGYFEAALQWRLATVPPARKDGLEHGIQQALSSVCGSRAVEPATTSTGTLGAGALVGLPANVDMPMHIEELYYQTDSAFATVVPGLGLDGLFTFSAIIEPATAGGVLQFYDRFSHEISEPRSYTAIKESTRGLEPLELQLHAGDLVFFDGLTIVHGVTAPVGCRRVSCIGHAGPVERSLRYFV